MTTRKQQKQLEIELKLDNANHRAEWVTDIHEDLQYATKMNNNQNNCAKRVA